MVYRCGMKGDVVRNLDAAMGATYDGNMLIFEGLGT
jgi:hypothetical protein